MLRDVLRCLRHPDAFQIGWRSEDPLPHRPYLPRHERRVRHGGPDTDRDVEASFDHVHHPVIHRQCQPQIGIGVEERRKDRRDHRLPEGTGGIDLQVPAHRPGAVADPRLDLAYASRIPDASS